MSPGTAPNRVAALRRALAAMLRDPVVGADRSGLDISGPKDGDELQALVARLYACRQTLCAISRHHRAGKAIACLQAASCPTSRLRVPNTHAGCNLIRLGGDRQLHRRPHRRSRQIRTCLVLLWHLPTPPQPGDTPQPIRADNRNIPSLCSPSGPNICLSPSRHHARPGRVTWAWSRRDSLRPCLSGRSKSRSRRVS